MQPTHTTPIMPMSVITLCSPPVSTGRSAVGAPLFRSLRMLTPSLPVKRRVVWPRYGAQIEALFGDGEKSKGAAATA